MIKGLVDVTTRPPSRSVSYTRCSLILCKTSYSRGEGKGALQSHIERKDIVSTETDLG